MTRQDSYQAIIVGATGAVGAALVRELLASPRCTRVTALVRRRTDASAGRTGGAELEQRVVDMADLEAAAAAVRGATVAFCTMGVGQPRKVSREELWKVDVEQAAAFARGCRSAGVRHISLLGSTGAQTGSRTHYFHAKGSAEDALAALGFARASFYRPSLLVTPNIRYGLQDRLTQAIFPILAWFLPSRFHPIRVEDLARAMRVNAERSGGPATEVLQYRELVALNRG